MPRGDRTGPGGKGPMTGRKAGYCAGGDKPGYKNNSRFAGMRQRIGFTLRRKGDKLFVREAGKRRSIQILPKTKAERKNIDKTVREMKKNDIKEIEMNTTVNVKTSKNQKKKKPVKSEPSRVKDAMGKNTSLFIQGKRSRKKYLETDDKLHDRLFRALKKKGKGKR